MRTRARKDINHHEILTALSAMGVSVIDTAEKGNGFPDAVIGIAGVTELIEIKNPDTPYGRRGLSARQQRWADDWRGSKPRVVRSLDDAIALVREMQRSGK